MSDLLQHLLWKEYPFKIIYLFGIYLLYFLLPWVFTAVLRLEPGSVQVCGCRG